MKLWIDDLRDPPDNTWVWAKTSNEAVDALCDHNPMKISFDHDLGGDDTSMEVIKYIELWSHKKLIDKFDWQVHSMNPVGRQNIIRAMNKIEEIWKENEK